MTHPFQIPDVIDRIYDAGLDPERWGAILKDVAVAAGCRTAGLFVTEGAACRGRLLASHNWDSDLSCKAFLERRLAAVAREGEVYVDASTSAGRGLLVLPLTGAGNTGIGAWCVADPLKGGAIDPATIAALQRLSTHIQRGIRAARQSEEQRSAAARFEAALEALAWETFVVDSRGLVLFRNAAASTEIATGPLFRERNGRLVGLTPETAAVAARIANACSGNSQQRSGDAEVTAPDGQVVHVSWVALDETTDALLVMMQSRNSSLGAAVERFELTAAEAQVLAQLLEGVTLGEAAAKLGVARSTVKSHLDSIFRKSDTRRQAELVQRTLNLRSPLRL